jgi:hypothetical protein
VDSGLFGRSTIEDGTDMLQRGVQFAVDAPQLATLADLTSDIEAEAGLRLVDGDDAGPAALGDGASVVGLDWATVHLVFCHIFTCSVMVIIIFISARSAVRSLFCVQLGVHRQRRSMLLAGRQAPVLFSCLFDSK